MRKFGVVVFAVILFASLLALAFSTSSNIAFTNPNKLARWLNDSNLYGAFVENAINQAEQTAGTDQSGGVSLSDSAVKQAAETSFSSPALKQDVNTFLNSNYAWLEGKTSQPNFKIDLASQKQDFAQRVGSYVTTYLNGLPACTPQQESRLNPQTADPLTLSCRPSGVDPATVGSEVNDQIATSTDFLSSTIVTAANINPNGSVDQSGQPYYQKFPRLPKIYQAGIKVPYVAGIVALLSLLAILFTARRKRQGVKAITVVLVLAGVVMVLNKFVSDQVFKQIRDNAFNASTVGELQKALVVFLNHAESQLVKIDLWFGVAYLLVALILVVALIATRRRGLRIPKSLQATAPVDDTEEPATPAASPKPALAPKPKPSQPPSRPASKPPRPPRPPRLVQ